MGDANVQESKNDRRDRLMGLTFHRTFSLNRPALKTLLQLALTHGGIELTRKIIREETNLGTIYIEAMPRYGYGAGLLDSKNRLTIFGKLACLYDPLLEQIGTQWLMHYYLSSHDGPGPDYWNNLVVTFFRSGDEFTQEEISTAIYNYISEMRGTNPRRKDADTTARIFIGSYIKADGFNNLGVINEISPRCYRVLEPEPPPTWSVACALLDLWQAQFSDQATINLNDLYGVNGLTSIFMIGKGHLNSILEEIQQEGVIELYRIAPPYQIVMLQPDMEKFLEKLYATKVTD
jgi:hypothetical protein